MTCMCGDTYCPSCGPAQGNYKCPNCGMWSADGGCENPRECGEENHKADVAMADEIERDAKLAEEYLKTQ